MKIKNLTQIGILLCIVVTVTMGSFIIMTTQKMKIKAHEAVLVAKTIKDITELKNVMHEYLLHSEKRSLIQWKSKYNFLSKSFIQKKNKFDSQNKKILFSLIYQNFLRIGITFERLSAEIKEGLKNDKLKDTSFLKLKNRLIGELLVSSQSMVSLVFQLQQKVQTEIVIIYKRAISLIFTFFVLLVFFVVGMSFWVNNSVAKPIKALEEGVRIIGSGNLNYKVGTSAKNEIGKLSRAFDKMVMDLKESTTSISELNKEIVERKRAEKIIVRYRHIFEDSLNEIYVFDSDTLKFIEVNKAALDNLGYSMEELKKLTPLDIKSEISAESFKKIIAALIKGEKKKVVFETVHKRKDQSYYDVEVHLQFMKYDNKEMFTAIILNITDRKMSKNLLRESENKYRTMMESMRDGVYITSSEFKIEYMNSAMVERIGKETTGEFCYKAIYDLDEKCSWCVLDQILQSKHVDFEMTDPKDGHHYSTTNSPIVHTDGAISKLTIFHDITEIKNIELQLQQAQKMESVGRLAGGVAHDYNNVLSVIMGYTEFAMDTVDKSEPLYEYLNEVLKAAERARNITRQLLAFARKQTISPEVLKLNDNVDSMLKMLRRLVGEDIYLVWLPGNNLWPVKMDPTQIDQILVNLCVNARDAIKGVGKITIETNTVAFDSAYCGSHSGFIPGEFVLLAVSDNGCGMNKKTLSNIFEPFFTTKAVDKGTGLGLSTVYGIVKQNKGFINVYSEPGEGTTIKIYLPRNEGKPAETQEESTEKILQGHGETILLVEDDLSILKLTEKNLNGLGYTVLTADTPKGAMKLAEEHTGKIHLLLTDVIMPEMNGRELSERLQSHYPNLKYIFMSGYTANAIAHHGVLDEGMKFIQKPFSKSNLAKIVREVLDKNKN